MGVEFFLVAAGLTLLVIVLARRQLFERRLALNKSKLENLKFSSELPAEVDEIFKKAPRIKGDGKFAFQAVGTFPFAENYEKIRIAKRIFFIEPTVIDVLLLPEPGNFERKLAVAITVDSKLLGYVPTNEAGELHNYLLAHSAGLVARAKIYLGSRPEFHTIWLDFAKPFRLESKRRQD